MKVEPLSGFVCPLDGAWLEPSANGVRCPAGHSFDRAREGYLHLLPVQHKASRDPGDDQAMVSARRRILDAGLFKPVADVLVEHVRAGVRRDVGDRPWRVVDAGCGEGYYLAHLREAAQHCGDDGTLALAGYDISKWAVRAAARRSQAIAWAVASNRQPPFAPASVDCVLCVFGFPHWAAFAAILLPHGRVLSIDAGAEHLLELRTVIYPEVRIEDAPPPLEAVAQGWQPCAEQRLQYKVRLDSAAQIQALVAMTPHAHRMPAAGRAALAELSGLEVTMSVIVRELEVPPPR